MIEDYINKIIQGKEIDVLKSLPSKSVDCIFTSLDHLVVGSEYDELLKRTLEVFKEAKRVIISGGNCIVNVRDYTVGKENLVQMLNFPARFSLEMQKMGWVLRDVMIWKNFSSIAVVDMPFDFEYVYLFTDGTEENRIDFRNFLSDEKVEFAPSFEELIRDKFSEWCPTFSDGDGRGAIILDPFFGTGLIGELALKNGRRFIGIVPHEYLSRMAYERIMETIKSIQD
jgi:DNA modification methylase